MSHVLIKRDLVERRHRARAANEPGIKVFGYEAFNNAGAHIGKTYEVSALPTNYAALEQRILLNDTPADPALNTGRCQGCTPQACTWADLSDEEIEAQHRHWQTMGNGWSGA